jgi:hypothetical protein
MSASTVIRKAGRPTWTRLANLVGAPSSAVMTAAISVFRSP